MMRLNKMFNKEQLERASFWIPSECIVCEVVKYVKIPYNEWKVEMKLGGKMIHECDDCRDYLDSMIDDCLDLEDD